MLGLDDDDVFLDVEPPVTTPLAQTASLGVKQSCVRWLPTAAPVALAGSWDEESTNELSLWCVQVLGDGEMGADVAMHLDGEPSAPPAISAQQAAAVSHPGDVLGLSIGGGSGPLGGGPLLAFTASGAGGVACYDIQLADVSAGAGGVLTERWRSGSPAGGLATLGVCWGAEAGAVAAVGEDGALTLLSPERGAAAWSAQTSEPALFDVCWWDAHVAVAAGTTLGLWDTRIRGAAAAQLVLSPSPGTQAHLAAQLLTVTADPQPPYSLAAGASDGAVHLWDARAARSAAGGAGGATRGAGEMPPLRSVNAHAAEVWSVQIARGAHGHMLTASSDGTLSAWQLGGGEAAAGGDGAGEAVGRTLVQLALPINSLHLSPEHGMLASASDAQVLTFVDLRA